jgi:RNA-directed DNA polymerase
MEGQLQKREVRILEATLGKAGRNLAGSQGGAIHRTSGKESFAHNATQMMEQLVERSNMNAAYKRVVANKGAPGVDRITTEGLRKYSHENWPRIKQELLDGTYQPQPVRRVQIPKPNGGTRKLGIPTVIDRLIQQALQQILSPIFEPIFSRHSYGFRPGRKAQDAVNQAKAYIREGRRWVVDMDLEKFFDKVDHDILMERIRKKIKDVRILNLIRKYLKAGVMEDGVVTVNEQGTPQGGPLSPLLSNIMLTDLDQELEKRQHAFCRYADDCNIYVKSEVAGKRVLASITRFLETKLKLKVNPEKSAVGRPWQRKFLGFSMTSQKQTRIRVHEKSVEKIKEKVRELCRIGRGCNIKRFIAEQLNPVIRGWINYFKHADVSTYAKELDAWIRRRLRVLMWKQWGRAKSRFNNLMKLGIERKKAFMMGYSSKGPWRMSSFKTMAEAIPWKLLEDQDLISMFQIIREH